MSGTTTTLNTNSQLNIDRETSIIFLWDNRYDSETYENTTGGELTLPAGTVMGRIAASGKLLPLKSAAIDGSQYPVGILTEAHTVADTVEVTVSICVSGDVAQEKLVFDGSDTTATIIDGRQLGDRIGSDTVGINLVPSTDLTAYDN